jgi:ABC-type Fe3+-hydroxamate transport system substrate-binding protein
MRSIRVWKKIIPVIFLGAVVLLSACTTEQQKLLEGVLQNVDSANGKITIVDKDGQTHVITIQSGSVQTQSGSSAIEGLEPGTKVKIEMEDEDNARKVDAELARVSGTISQADAVSSNITVTPGGGASAVTVHITGDTRIRLGEERTGSFSDLTVGANVSVKYDPSTGTALKVSLGEKEQAEIEGNITAVSGSNITIKTERDRSVTLTTNNTTLIRNRGAAGTTANLTDGLKVNAKFDPFTMIASRIEIQGDQGEGNDEERDQDERDGEDEDERENGGRGEVEGPPGIPHTLEGRADCLVCHQTGVAGAPRVPADHAGRTSAVCQTCHKPK